MLKLIGTKGCHEICYDYRIVMGLHVGDVEIDWYHRLSWNLL